MNLQRRMILLMLLLLLVGGAISVSAQEGATASENPADNICYAGGLWEGKCQWPTEAETEWAWTCGWYIARVMRGAIPAENLPLTCGEQLSPTSCANGTYAHSYTNRNSNSYREPFQLMLCIDANDAISLNGTFSLGVPILDFVSAPDQFASEADCIAAAQGTDRIAGFFEVGALFPMFEGDSRTLCFNTIPMRCRLDQFVVQTLTGFLNACYHYDSSMTGNIFDVIMYVSRVDGPYTMSFIGRMGEYMQYSACEQALDDAGIIAPIYYLNSPVLGETPDFFALCNYMIEL